MSRGFLSLFFWAVIPLLVAIASVVTSLFFKGDDVAVEEEENVEDFQCSILRKMNDPFGN